MSASKALFGMVPMRKVGSNYNSTAQSQYAIANGLASNIFHGDLVTISAGNITPVATTTDFAIGVFMGCEYTDPTTKQPTFSRHFPANTSSIHNSRVQNWARAAITDLPAPKWGYFGANSLE